MDDIIPIEDTARQVKMLAILRRVIEEGETRAAACRAEGIHPRTFTRWLQANPEQGSQFVQSMRDGVLSSYEQLAKSREKAVQRLVDEAEFMAEAEGDDFDVGELMKVEKRLAEIQVEFETTIGRFPSQGIVPVNPPGSSSESSSNAAKFLESLKGPNLRSAKMTIEINNEPDRDVVDGTVKE